jgi:hypothetical protein
MKKYLLVISSYNDYRQEHFEKYHSPRNKQYCEHHGFEYIEIKNLNDIPEHCRKRKIVWDRFFLIKHWIDTGFLKDGDIISQIDADICIVNGNYPFEPPQGKSFAYAIDSCNTHCMGAFTFRVTEWTKTMLNNLLDENRWNKFKDTPFWQMFHEQACWYSLAGIKDTFADPKQPGWDNFEHLGWNTTTNNDPIYTLDELYKNVEILPVEWNVTVWNAYNQYFRFPTKTNNMEDVIFRHFAGGLSIRWETQWTNIPLIK